MPAESGDKPLLYLFLTFSTPVESGARIYYCDLLIICPLYQTFYGYCYLLYLYQARSSIQTSFILHFFGRTILAPLNMVEPCTRLAPDATAHARQVDLVRRNLIGRGPTFICFYNKFNFFRCFGGQIIKCCFYMWKTYEFRVFDPFLGHFIMKSQL